MFPCVEKAFASTIIVAAGPKNIITHFPGAITHRLSTHKPPICFHRCILMLYAAFDNFHALANPSTDKIFSGGGRKSTFLCFFDLLEIEFLTIYEVSRPLHRRKPFVVTFPIIPRLKGTISTSTGSLNLLPNFNSVCFQR